MLTSGRLDFTAAAELENVEIHVKSGEKKTGHVLRSIAHQISILELKLIKRGPNEMS